MDLDALCIHLKETEFFHGCTKDEILRIVKFSHERALTAESTLFKLGEPSDALHILLTGSLHVINAEGSITAVPQYGIVGEMGVFTDRTRSATVVTPVASTTLEIPGRPLLELLERDHELGFKLYRNVTQILAKYLRRNNLLLEFYGMLEAN